MLHKLKSRHFTENHCFAKNCCEGQHIAGISNAAAVKNHVYFWQNDNPAHVNLSLPSEAAGKDERQHGKRRVLESQMKYWTQNIWKKTKAFLSLNQFR